MGVHVRMPDIAGEDISAWQFNIPEFDFYLDSMNYYMNKYKNVIFLCFSNNTSWASEYYNFNIFNNLHWMHDGSIFNDMCLLTLCDHYIISPSTFGWWSAFLSINKDKEVIMATPLFNKETHVVENEFMDLQVPGWKIWRNKGDI